MITLPNDCSCSELSVNPKNWLTCKLAQLQKNWYIHYRFHDPQFEADPKYKYGKLVIIKGMNQFSTLDQRRIATKELIVNEIKQLRDEGYNPISGKRFIAPEDETLIQQNLTFIGALDFAKTFLEVAECTTNNIESVIRNSEIGAKDLKLWNLSIKSNTKTHKKLLFTHLAKINPRWSNNLYNYYCSYLSMLFAELVCSYV